MSSPVTAAPNAAQETGANSASLLQPDKYQINPTTAEVAYQAISHRVIWHRAVAALIIVAALAAIAVGITLIYQAGNLAKVQREEEVKGILERANALTDKIRKIQSDADTQISHLRLSPYAVEDDKQRLKDDQSKLAAETVKSNLDDDKDTVTSDQAQIKQDQETVSQLDALIKNVIAKRDADIAPLQTSEKQVNAELEDSGNGLELNALIIRVAAVLLIVFLVQTFISIFRYITRLGAYYQARADSLRLVRDNSISIEDFKMLTGTFSPDLHDFGKLPRGPTEQALDIAKTIISSQTKER